MLCSNTCTGIKVFIRQKNKMKELNDNALIDNVLIDNAFITTDVAHIFLKGTADSSSFFSPQNNLVFTP